MTAKILDGNAIAEQLRAGVAEAVQKRVAAGLPRPGLATVLVGDNPGSQSYVRSKRKASAEVVLNSRTEARSPGNTPIAACTAS